MRKRMLFIYNPIAGKGRIKAKLSGIIELYSASDYEVIIHATVCRGDAVNVTEQYVRNGQCDLIVCAGGDGTLDEVTGAIMRCGRRIPVALIPAGSTNDFGYTLGIPKGIINAAKNALTGRVFSCDIATFNDRYYSYTASFGLFSDVSYNTSQQLKNVFGHMAYIINGITKLSQVKVYHVKAEAKGITYENEYIYGMVVSSNSVGGFRGITGKGVELNDGLHELIMVKKPASLAGLTVTINELLAHRFDGECIDYARVSEVTFTSKEKIAWSLDGEYGGSSNYSVVKVIKRGVDYICPATSVRNHVMKTSGIKSTTGK